MAITLDGDMSRLKFELDNARKDLRYYTHLAESLNVPSIVGEAVHQSRSRLRARSGMAPSTCRRWSRRRNS